MSERLRSVVEQLDLPVRLPGKAAQAYRAGANLAPEQAVGHRIWEEFLGRCLRLEGGNR